MAVLPKPDAPIDYEARFRRVGIHQRHKYNPHAWHDFEMAKRLCLPGLTAEQYEEGIKALGRWLCL